MIASSRVRTKPQNDTQLAKLLSKEGGRLGLPRVGELIRGTVLSVGTSEVIVDIGGVFTGIIRGFELKDELGVSNTLEVGNPIESVVLDIDNEMGSLELSLRSASHQRAWSTLIDYKRNGKNLEVEVSGANRGGLIVKLNNIYGFLPVSQLSREHYPNVDGNKNLILEKLQQFVRQKLTVKVIGVEEQESKLIVSEKEAVLDAKLSQDFPHAVGDRVEGVVKGITDFGVFIEFGEYEGLIHISEINTDASKPFREQFEVGSPLTAEIVSVQRGRIALSLKRMDTPQEKKETDDTSTAS